MTPEPIYVLTHEYSDGSAFDVCGVTLDRAVARVWYVSGTDNHVYAMRPGEIVSSEQSYTREQFDVVVTVS